MPELDVGIAEADRSQIADGLAHVLADTYTLYLKTHNYHWNVTGPMFPVLHQLFEEQYRDMWGAVDLLAERIRALGAWAPGTYEQLAKMTRVTEDPEGERPDADTMVRNLSGGHQVLIKSIREVLPVAQKADDETTLDILIERLRWHEKTAWMVRSLLG